MPNVYFLCGLPGTGKTTYARFLERSGAIRLSLDEELFALFGRTQTDGTYVEAELKTKAALTDRMMEYLSKGTSVILDWGFWKREERMRVAQLVRDNKGNPVLLYFSNEMEHLVQRVQGRDQTKNHDITPEMLADFAKRFEEPKDEGQIQVHQLDASFITLKGMTEADVDAFLALEEKVKVPKIYNPITNTADALDEIQTNELFFIESEGTTVGTIAYAQKPDGSYYISNVAVLPEYRGKGIARLAMQKILEHISPAHRVWLVVHPENENALKLYTSLGFKQENRVENYYGDGEPRVVMAINAQLAK